MTRLMFLRRLWYNNQYRKYRNKIIDLKFRIDYLHGLEAVRIHPVTVVRLKAISCRLKKASVVNERLHVANRMGVDRHIRNGYRSELKIRLRSVNNSLMKIELSTKQG